MLGGASRRTESSAAGAAPAAAPGAGAPAAVAPGFEPLGFAPPGVVAPAADAPPARGADREAALVSDPPAGAGAEASRRPEEQASTAANRQTDRCDGDMRTLIGRRPRRAAGARMDRGAVRRSWRRRAARRRAGRGSLR